MLDGEFFHTGYTHCCCDNELYERCQEKGLFYYARDAVVLHDHPIINKKPVTDPDLIRVYSKEVWGRDKILLEKRRRNGWK
jgi:hypothetical protein